MADQKPVISGGDRESPVASAFSQKTLSDTIENPFYVFRPWNPDDLYQVNGDYSIYEDMRQDDQVGASLQLKKDMILGSGGYIEPAEDGQDEIVADLERAINQDLSMPFMDYLEEMLDDEDMGFSLTEKIYKQRDDGTLTLGELRTRHPGSWLIHTDDKGNIEKYEQRGAATNVFIKPSENKLIHMINKPKYMNPYGTSSLRNAHLAWISKREAIKYYDIFLEMMASPKPVGKYPLNAKEGIASKLSQILKSFQAKTSLTIPKEVEVEFLEAKSNGEAFEKAINLWNMLIGRAMLIPDLMGFTGGETKGGSFSLGIEQINIFLKHIERRQKKYEDAINKQILAPIIQWNWGEVENPPLFKFLPLRDDVATENAKMFLEAVRGKVYKPSEEEINHFRKIIKFPEGEVEFEKPAPALSIPGNIPPGRAGSDPEGSEGESKNNDTDKSKLDELQGDEKRFAMDDKFKAQRDMEKDMKRKVDFEKAKSTLSASVSKIVDGSRPIVSDMIQSAVDQVEKKKILQRKDIGLVDSIKFKGLKNIQTLMKKEFRELHDLGGKQARSEIFAKAFADSSPLMNDEFLAVIDDETFEAVGKIKTTATGQMKVALQEAIKSGAPLSSVIPILEDEIGTAIETSIERWARTKTTEVFNKGRLAFFDSTGVVVGYQYSAIMDDRTTLVCAGLHGKRFRKGDQPTPPMHFNCRSILIPITQFEEFEADTSVGGEVFVGGRGAERTKKNFPKTGGIIRVPNEDIGSFIKKNAGKGFNF